MTMETDYSILAAVLDIDSPVENRFSGEDREGLEAFARIIEDTAVYAMEE